MIHGDGTILYAEHSETRQRSARHDDEAINADVEWEVKVNQRLDEKIKAADSVENGQKSGKFVVILTEEKENKKPCKSRMMSKR